MRIRTIKPEFWTDPFMVSIPHFARLFYISLFGVADDYGYIEDEPERIAMLVMPVEDPMDVYEWLDFFVASERLELMLNDDGTRSLRLVNFQKHQKVDKPTKSKIARESSRKVSIPFQTRRGVATKYNCEPGESKTCECYYCGSEGRIHWHRLRSGRPSSWISFANLELDHLVAESVGGSSETDNIVLACRRCNRTKGSKNWIPFIKSINPTAVIHQDSGVFENSREDSPLERKGKESNGMEGNNVEGTEILELIPPNPNEPKRSKSKATLEEAKAFALSEGMPASDGEAFWNGKEGTGWAKVKDWRATFRNWKAQGWLASQRGFTPQKDRNAGTHNEGHQGNNPYALDTDDIPDFSKP